MFYSTGLHFNGRLIAFPANNWLWLKCITVGNTQTYYDPATIMAIKDFIVWDSTLMAGSYPCCQIID